MASFFRTSVEEVEHVTDSSHQNLLPSTYSRLLANTDTDIMVQWSCKDPPSKKPWSGGWRLVMAQQGT
jgi:hypothetical protein